MGTNYWLSKKLIQSYVDEFVFRFDTRKYTITERSNLLLQNIEHRLTYKELIYG